MTYLEFKAAQSALEAAYKQASQALDHWKPQRLPNGLTPDHVRALPAWQVAKAAFDKAWQAFRAFNGQYVKQFDKQIRADIDARRAAILAGRDIS